VPAGEKPVRPIFGLLKDSVAIYGDTAKPAGEAREADGQKE